MTTQLENIYINTCITMSDVLPLPDDIIEIIDIMRWKLEMVEVLDDIHSMTGFPSEEFCENCIYHGCLCANCAIYAHHGKYGPGFMFGKVYCTLDDKYETDITNNINMWKSRVDPCRYENVTFQEFIAVLNKPQNQV
jgi:hypothetical protein